MMLAIYFISTLASIALLFCAKNRNQIVALSAIFYALQIYLAADIAMNHIGETQLNFFTFDNLGVLCFIMLTVISALTFYHSIRYLDSETTSQFRVYNQLLILLCSAITATYFANNLAVTWILIEATTIFAAGLIYHRRNQKSLEATWKYIFVCSTGIAIAYLGILLISSAAIDGELSYSALATAINSGNMLYMKIAFIFILVGYSSKMEIFPLYTIGVDANLVCPTPASALISSGLVNAGFVAIFRVLMIYKDTPIFSWVSNVLIVAGVASLFIGVLYLRQTNNYKRMLSYSTVENMGIVAIGLGIGGYGVYAAILHIVAHSLIKSGMFFQISQVGKKYGTYRINRINDYLKYCHVGGIAIILGAILLLAFPPSGLFVSELMIVRQVVTLQKWWLLAVIVLMLCIAMYGVLNQVIKLSYTESTRKTTDYKIDIIGVYLSFGLIISSCILGLWQPEWFVEFVNAILNMYRV